MRVWILAWLVVLGGCAADRETWRDRPFDKWYTTSRTYDVLERCLRWSERRLGPLTVSSEGTRRHLRFGDDLLLVLSPGPDDLTRIEIWARHGYPEPMPGAVRATTIRQHIENCL